MVSNNKKGAKLFVGGVNRETDEDVLKQHFGKYGQVKEALIVFDKLTGISRGFGFVTFEDLSAANQALQHKHVILGRKVDVKLATPKNQEFRQEHGNEDSCKRIFVGGLPPKITKEEFKNFFESFGSITDVILMYNKTTGKQRGFGYISFDSEDSVNTLLLQNRFHELNGHLIEVKRARPKSKNKDKNKMDFIDTYPPYYSYFWGMYGTQPYYYPPCLPFSLWAFPKNYLNLEVNQSITHVNDLVCSNSSGSGKKDDASCSNGSDNQISNSSQNVIFSYFQ